MKRLLVIAVVVAVALAVVPAALAAHGKGKGKKVFTAHGKVTAVHDEAGTFSMKVRSGARMRSQRGKVVTINVTQTTKIWRVVNGKRTAIALADMKAGERVWAKGTFKRANGARDYTARWVRLKATWPVRARARITAIDPDAKTVTLRIWRRHNRALRAFVGKEVTFQTTDATKFRLRQDRKTTTIGFGDLAVDDRVTVWGYADNQDPTDRVYVARRILVRR